MSSPASANLAVGILTHNSSRYVERLIESLHRQTCRPRRVFAVDNGSADTTVQILESRGVEVYPEANLGVGAGHTRSITAAFSDPAIEYVLLLEHDCFLAATCIERLVDALEILGWNGEGTGALTCQTVHPDEDAAVVEAAELGELDIKIEPSSRVTFNGLLLSWNAIAAVGFPRSDFFVGQEDSDYYRRLRRMGVSIHRVGGAVLAHHGKGRERREEDVQLSRRAYSKRNSTYRDAMVDGHLGRALLRLAHHSLRSSLLNNSDDRLITKAVADGLTGRLGKLADQPGGTRMKRAHPRLRRSLCSECIAAAPLPPPA